MAKNTRNAHSVVAANRHADLKAEFEARLARLVAATQKDPAFNPAVPNWGDIGTLTHYMDLLSQINDSVFGEGEFAE